MLLQQFCNSPFVLFSPLHLELSSVLNYTFYWKRSVLCQDHFRFAKVARSPSLYAWANHTRLKTFLITAFIFHTGLSIPWKSLHIAITPIPFLSTNHHHYYCQIWSPHPNVYLGPFQSIPHRYRKHEENRSPSVDCEYIAL